MLHLDVLTVQCITIAPIFLNSLILCFCPLLRDTPNHFSVSKETHGGSPMLCQDLGFSKPYLKKVIPDQNLAPRVHHPSHPQPMAGPKWGAGRATCMAKDFQLVVSGFLQPHTYLYLQEKQQHTASARGMFKSSRGFV